MDIVVMMYQTELDVKIERSNSWPGLLVDKFAGYNYRTWIDPVRGTEQKKVTSKIYKKIFELRGREEHGNSHFDLLAEGMPEGCRAPSIITTEMAGRILCVMLRDCGEMYRLTSPWTRTYGHSSPKNNIDDLFRILHSPPTKIYSFEYAPLFPQPYLPGERGSDRLLFYNSSKANLEKKTHQSVPGISFRSGGGLVESPNILSIVQQLTHLSGESIIVLPESLRWLWSDTPDTVIITHEDLISREKVSVTKYHRQVLFVHELHDRLLPIVKRLASVICAKTILVLNYLPLTSYFTQFPFKNNRDNALFNHHRYINLWAGFDYAQKTKHEEAVSSFLRVHLGNVFLRMRGPIDDQREIFPSSSVKLNPGEKMIVEHLRSVFENTHQKGPIPRSAYMETLRKVYSRALKAFSNTSETKKMGETRREIAKHSIETLEGLHEKLSDLESKYRLAHLTNDDAFPRPAVKMGKMLRTIYQQRASVEKSLLNHRRYLSDLQSELRCSVCYDDCQEISPVVSICGHSYCLECALQSITHKRSCPVCREEMTLDRLSIGSGVNFFDRFPPDVCLATDLDISSIQSSRPILTLSTLTKYQALIENCSRLVYITAQKRSGKTETRLERFRSQQLISYVRAYNQNLVEVQILDWEA